MKSYLIVDRNTENTKYYAGLNGWVSLPENAIWYETLALAEQQKAFLKDDTLKVEETNYAEISEIADVFNFSNWYFSHNGLADTSKLEIGCEHLRKCHFSSEDIIDAIDNCGYVDMGSGIDEIVTQIAPNVAVDKLRQMGVYDDVRDENGTYKLLYWH